jgi:hypothetical protein
VQRIYEKWRKISYKNNPNLYIKKSLDYYNDHKNEVQKQHMDYNKNNPEKSLFLNIKQRIKRLKLQDLDFDVKYIKQLINDNKHCQCCEILLMRNEDYQYDNSRSVDRINIKYGYTKNNILIVCNKCNRIKNNLTKNELFMLTNDSRLIIKNKDENYWKLIISEKKLKDRYWHKKSNAKTLNVEFNLTIDFLKSIIVKYCPVLEIELDYYNSRHKDNSPSFDRIDPNKGYTEDNTRIISRKANQSKSNASLEEIKLVCNFYSKFDF